MEILPQCPFIKSYGAKLDEYSKDKNFFIREVATRVISVTSGIFVALFAAGYNLFAAVTVATIRLSITLVKHTIGYIPSPKPGQKRLKDTFPNGFSIKDFLGRVTKVYYCVLSAFLFPLVGAVQPRRLTASLMKLGLVKDTTTGAPLSLPPSGPGLALPPPPPPSVKPPPAGTAGTRGRGFTSADLASGRSGLGGSNTAGTQQVGGSTASSTAERRTDVQAMSDSEAFKKLRRAVAGKGSDEDGAWSDEDEVEDIRDSASGQSGSDADGNWQTDPDFESEYVYATRAEILARHPQGMSTAERLAAENTGLEAGEEKGVQVVEVGAGRGKETQEIEEVEVLEVDAVAASSKREDPETFDLVEDEGSDDPKGTTPSPAQSRNCSGDHLSTPERASVHKRAAIFGAVLKPVEQRS